MYCRNCGKEVAEQAVMCPNCGVPPRNGKKFCQNCGAETDVNAEMCVKCGVRLSGNGRDWLVTLLLCIFLGGWGVHRFYTGSIGIGVAQLLTLGCCGIWTLIDFILILTGSYKDGDGQLLVRR
jgi:RNA polymerase subunit RPABC4/transcription elongation factor Spt4